MRVDGEPGPGRQVGDDEAAGPDDHVGGLLGPVGQGEPGRVHGGHLGVLDEPDPQPVDDPADVPGAAGRQVVAERAGRDQGRRDRRVGLGDLGRGLQSGQPGADDGEAAAPAGEPRGEAGRAGRCGDVERVLGDRGVAAEGEDEHVVVQRPAVAQGHAVRDGVETEDAVVDEPHAGPRQQVGEAGRFDGLPGGELVQADPLDEAVAVVHQRHRGIGAPGERLRGELPAVAPAEHHHPCPLPSARSAPGPENLGRRHGPSSSLDGVGEKTGGSGRP